MVGGTNVGHLGQKIRNHSQKCFEPLGIEYLPMQPHLGGLGSGLQVAMYHLGWPLHWPLRVSNWILRLTPQDGSIGK